MLPIVSMAVLMLALQFNVNVSNNVIVSGTNKQSLIKVSVKIPVNIIVIAIVNVPIHVVVTVLLWLTHSVTLSVIEMSL